jgi:hypothetical protein
VVVERPILIETNKLKLFKRPVPSEIHRDPDSVQYSLVALEIGQNIAFHFRNYW